MIKHYLLLAIRSWKKNLLVSILNLSGLIIGVTASLLILQYIAVERSYDNFHQDKDQIYRVALMEYEGGESSDLSASNYYGVGETLVKEFPEIKSFTSIHNRDAVVTYQGQSFEEDQIYYVEPNFLSFFTYPVVSGHTETALVELGNVVISKRAAQKYFGAQNPIDQVISFNRDQDFRVAAVVESPLNSHFQFDFLINNEELLKNRYRPDNNIWNWSNFYIYIKTDPGIDPIALQDKYSPLLDQYIEDEHVTRDHILQPVDDIYLHSDLNWEIGPIGNSKLISVLLVIALLIVSIAIINYVNLSTAYATERAKEVGVRKVAGANKSQLIRQFLFQSFIFCLIAFSTALFIDYIISPVFNQVVGKEIVRIQDFIVTNGAAIGLVFLISVMLTGIYPALIMSNFKPVEVLKGRLLESSGGLSLRKSLTVFQFTVSICLIIGTILIYKQLNFMKNKELGFTKDQTLIVAGPMIKDSTFEQRLNTFKANLEGEAGITSVAISNSVPSKSMPGVLSGFRRKEADPNSSVLMAVNGVDEQYMEVYEMALAAGRNFSRELDLDKNRVLLNESGARAIGFDDPASAINQLMSIGSGTTNYEIVGVLKDYHHRSLNETIEPMCNFYGTPFGRQTFSVRFNTIRTPELVSQIQNHFESSFPANPFSFSFMDESFERQYLSDQKTGQIILLFSGLAIFIACLGLFGLTSFMAIKKSKEIGIRKVLGASHFNILSLVSKEFVVLVGIALIIATPVSFFLLRNFLEKYPYRTSIDWWIFVVAGLIALLIALSTMSYQSIKSALSNPVEAIRNE